MTTQPPAQLNKEQLSLPFAASHTPQITVCRTCRKLRWSAATHTQLPASVTKHQSRWECQTLPQQAWLG
jgi:hypothetical protein